MLPTPPLTSGGHVTAGRFRSLLRYPFLRISST